MLRSVWEWLPHPSVKEEQHIMTTFKISTPLPRLTQEGGWSGETPHLMQSESWGLRK